MYLCKYDACIIRIRSAIYNEHFVFTFTSSVDKLLINYIISVHFEFNIEPMCRWDREEG